MAIVNHRHEIVVFPIHKNASSSIKRAMYRLETGHDFTAEIEERLGSNIHRMYPYRKAEKWEAYYDAYTTLAVVRDPIRRFLSAYANRVVVRKCLHHGSTPELLAARGLSPDPNLNEFVRNFRAYAQSSLTVRRHTYLQSSVIGPFFDRIRHVLPIERVGEFADILSRIAGEPCALPHDESGDPRISRADLDAANAAFLREHYAEDYRMLAGTY